MTATDHVIESLRKLPASEVARVLAAAEEILSHSPQVQQMTEDEFEQRLAAKGIITLPSSLTAEELAKEKTEFDAYEPVEVGGAPLSQMIIEERR